MIAVGGSNGKTGTKHLIHSVLSTRLRGSMSPKSFNNDVGVPLAIFPADPADDFLVLEIGTNNTGEVLHLSTMARPDVAVITAIGEEHLEYLHDLNGVRRENADITAGLNPDGLLVFNGDADGLAEAVAKYPGKTVRFGFEAGNDLRATEVQSNLDGTTFVVDGRPFFVPLVGRHSATNALAAVAVGRHLNLSDDDIRAGLATTTAPEWRLQIQRADGVTILNDAYNANPHSMRSALETLRDMPATGRKIAVLGDMLELGGTSEQHHRDIGRFAGECGLDELWTVGPAAVLIAEQSGLPGDRIRLYPDAAASAADAADIPRDGDLILVKASRGVGLERVAQAFFAAAANRSATSTVSPGSTRLTAVTADSVG